MNHKPSAERKAFAENQPLIIVQANELFAGSKPIGEFEQRSLNKAYRESLRKVPTLRNKLKK